MKRIVIGIFAPFFIQTLSQALPTELQLASDITACDATAFQTNWTIYRDTTSCDIVRQTATHLLELAQDIRTKKDLERTQKLGDKTGRTIAGLVGIPIVLFVLLSFPVMASIAAYILYHQFNGSFDQSMPPMSNVIKISILLLTLGILTKPHISYARFAGTEQVTKDIVQLDTIIILLTSHAQPPVHQKIISEISC